MRCLPSRSHTNVPGASSPARHTTSPRATTSTWTRSWSTTGYSTTKRPSGKPRRQRRSNRGKEPSPAVRKDTGHTPGGNRKRANEHHSTCNIHTGEGTYSLRRYEECRAAAEWRKSIYCSGQVSEGDESVVCRTADGREPRIVLEFAFDPSTCLTVCIFIDEQHTKKKNRNSNPCIPQLSVVVLWPSLCGFECNLGSRDWSPRRSLSVYRAQSSFNFSGPKDS